MTRRRRVAYNHLTLAGPVIEPMPVSVKNSILIYQALKSVGVRLISALPETWLVHLIQLAEDDPETTLVRLNKEEEGVGISPGEGLPKTGCHGEGARFMSSS